MKRIICQFSVLPCWCWKGGLTLIELVVVCAIIAMLVGIVWVVMAPAREKARQAVCISNLTQIGHAFRMYRDDWDGVEPQKGRQLEYWELGLPSKNSIFLHNTLNVYLKDESVWFCPSRFLLPFPLDSYQYLNTVKYHLNYCDHYDVIMGLSPRYDECMMMHSPAPYVSFRWVVSHVPDWGFVCCNAHHYFYFPKNDWADTLFLKLFLLISLFKKGEHRGIQQNFLNTKVCSNTINALKRAK